MKTMLLDIETSPLIVETWNRYPDYIPYSNIRQHRSIICSAWKELNVDGVEYTNQFKVLENEIDDTEICNNLHHALIDCDTLIMHNGKKFDLPIVRTHLLKRGFPPLPPIRVVDTLTLARKYFKFESNRLDDLGEFLGLGRKIKTEYRLWQEVIKGNKKAIDTMTDYNIQDVILLEDVYKALRPYFVNESVSNRIMSPESPCPSCGSKKGHQSRGWGLNLVTKYQRYQCKHCGAWNRGPNKPITEEV